MTATESAAAALPDRAGLLAFDLASVAGALEEVATTWRRAWLTRPELPLRLPLRLQYTARQLAADARELAAADPGPRPGRALQVAARLTALADGLASAKAMTCGSEVPPAGDAGLWDHLDAAMRRACSRLPGLVPA